MAREGRKEGGRSRDKLLHSSSFPPWHNTTDGRATHNPLVLHPLPTHFALERRQIRQIMSKQRCPSLLSRRTVVNAPPRADTAFAPPPPSPSSFPLQQHHPSVPPSLFARKRNKQIATERRREERNE